MRTSKSNAVVLDRDNHSISRKDIDHDALKVLYRLDRNGHTACLVGGAVRDLLIGRAPKDFDIGTSAHPNQVRKLFRNSMLVGRRFRLAHIRFGPKIIECSTFRKKPEPVDATNEEEDSLYQKHDNNFGTVEEDAQRRDFTINGILYNIRGFENVDHVGGLKDLRRKIIRTIGDPDTRMVEDPVRMLRAIRFAARLGFRIERRTWKSIVKLHGEILKAAPSRLSEEVQRLFFFGAGHDAMHLLRKCGLMKDLLPWVDNYLATSADKGKLFWRCLKALDASEAAGVTPSAGLTFAAMCYPMFAERMAEARESGYRETPLTIAREILSDVKLPKWAFYRVSHILEAQGRFETWQEGRFSKERFVARKDFLDAAIIYDVQTEAKGIKATGHKPWLALYKESGPGDERSEKGAAPAQNRRRRRRRRRPRDRPSGEPSG